VSLLDVNFGGFSSAEQQWISSILRLHVAMKKIYNFPEKSELPKFILPVKISWLSFVCGFWGGNEKFAEIRAGLLSHLAALPFDFTHTVKPHARVLQCEPARRLGMKRTHKQN